MGPRSKIRKLAIVAAVGTIVISGLLVSGGTSSARPVAQSWESVPASDQSGRVQAVVTVMDGNRPRYVEVSGSSAEEAKAKALAVPGAVAAGWNHQMKALGAPSNDYYRSLQWGLDDLDYDNAVLPSPAAVSQIEIAVVDSGVLATHPDLAGVVSCEKGWDGVGDGLSTNGCVDPHGHGTGVAAVAGAITNNGIGIAGLASGVKIIPIRVLDATGNGFSAVINTGIVRAVDAGADVINLSLGGPGMDPGQDAAIQYAIDNDVVVIAAAGNSGHAGNPVMYPAAFDNVLAVGATTQAGTVAAFSEHHPYVDISAPGEMITSANNVGWYSPVSGTSVAAPHVSAVAALVRAKRTGETWNEVSDHLIATSLDKGAPGKDDYFGHGYLQLIGALADPVTTTTTTSSTTTTAAPTTTTTTTPPPPPPTATSGYRMLRADGSVITRGSSQFYGDSQGHLQGRAVTLAATKTNNGYWIASDTGEVHSFGDAKYFGSMAGHRLNQPVINMAVTPTGNGYWLLAKDGGVFSFGDAVFLGSTGSMKLNQPAVAMAPTASGHGYWFVASDGGIFSFGDATFHGSMGGSPLNRPVVGMTVSTTGNGYRMVASDGGIFSFGDAAFHGSLGNNPPPSPVQAMQPTLSNNGYYMATRAGDIYAFGDANHFGGGSPDVVAMSY